ncbi:MAG: hypothetical protein SGARI_006191, partial [Bacillariaceae sp.]
MADADKNDIPAAPEPTTDDSSSNNNNTKDKDDDDDDKKDEDYAPSTVLIMLGSMHFEHAGNADVLSLKIDSPEDREATLTDASSRIAPNTLEALHLVLKASAISSLFDESLLSTFYEGLIPGTGEAMVHVLPASSALAEDMPVQAEDVDAIRMGFVMAGLRLEMEQAQDG